VTTDKGEQAIRDRVAGLAPGELSRLAERLGLLPSATPAGCGGADARAEPSVPSAPRPAEGPDVGGSLHDLPDSDVESMIERLLDAGNSGDTPGSPVGGRAADDEAPSAEPGAQPDNGLGEVGPSDLDAVLAVLLGEPAGSDHATGNGAVGRAGRGAAHRANGAASNGHADGIGARWPRRSPQEPGGQLAAAIRQAVDDLAWAPTGARPGVTGSSDGDAWARFVAAVTTAWRRLPDGGLSPAAAVEVGTLLVMGGTRGGAAPSDLSGSEGS
jgi:hypothetical protein